MEGWGLKEEWRPDRDGCRHPSLELRKLPGISDIEAMGHPGAK